MLAAVPKVCLIGQGISFSDCTLLLPQLGGEAVGNAVAAVSGSGDIVVMFSLISCYDSFRVC